MIVRDDPTSPWRRLGEEPAADESVDVEILPGFSTVGVKRALSPSDFNVPDAKRARGTSQAPIRTSGSCLAPKRNTLAQRIIENRDNTASSLGTGDVFLTENFRERWCRCASVGVLCFIPHFVSRDAVM